MEKLILGLLQEHLGKYIVGFRKEMVNASVLNGKGEIKDLSLNCAAINQQLSSVLPFIELDSIHISKVSFQVTSWTNLRKSPIKVDIEHISVHMSEPLHYLMIPNASNNNKNSKKRQRIRHMTISEMEQHFATLQEECKQNKTPFVNPNKRGGYNLVDRILDNLMLEIKSIYVQFQTWGKFKTRRPGPWTPPLLQFKLTNLRYVSVDEYGQEGTPDEVWAHNHKPVPRGQERTLLIFKKVSMEYDFGVQTATQQFSLFTGRGGVQPPVPSEDDDKDKKKREPSKPTTAESPTAAETVAALANATGPVSLPVPNAAAAETVAALASTVALGEADQQKEVETEATSPESDKTDSTTKDQQEPSNSQDKDATAEESATGDSPTSTTKAEGKNESDQEPSDKREEATPSTTKGKDNGEKNEAEKGKTATKDDDGHDHNNTNNNKVVVHMAMKRRVRDGALLAAQVDTTLSNVEMLIPAEVVPLLIHAALGVQFCLAKDRGFEDPLRSEDDHTDHNDASARNSSVRKGDKKKDQKEGHDENPATTENDNVEPAKEDEPQETGATSDDSKLVNGEGSGGKVEGGSTKKENGQEEGVENGEGSAAPTVATSASDAQVPQSSDDRVVTGGETTSNDGSETGGASVETSSVKIEEPQLKLPDSVLEVLESGGADNASITGDILAALDDTSIVGDNDSFDGSTISQLQPVQATKNFAKSISSLFSRRSVTAQSSSEVAKAAADAATTTTADSKTTTPTKEDTNTTVGAEGVKPVDRAIIMLPNGLVIHEKLSFSVSVDRATIRGVYPSRQQTKPTTSSTNEEKLDEDESDERPDNQSERQSPDGSDYIQVDSNGAVVELIWPKSNLKKGGYAQASVSYMSIQERYGKRIRTIMSGGVKQDPLAKPIEKPTEPPAEVSKEESFPLFEDRAIREDPLDLRRSFPAQALGLMTTIDCQRRKKLPPRTEVQSSPPTTITTSNANDSAAILEEEEEENNPQADKPVTEETDTRDGEEVVDVLMVTNDVGMEKVKVVFDCDCWCRALRFLLNEGGGGFDGRWLTGEWTDLLAIEMLVHPNTPLELEDHLQPITELFLDENLFVSSDLFHVNARISGSEIRVPAAIQENVRSCDIVAVMEETFVTVSSDLPREFLSANIGSTFRQQLEPLNPAPEVVSFPNDPLDVSVELQNSEDPSKRQNFVMTADTNKVVKAKSTFRVQIKLRGMSTQIMPIIPFFVASQPQQLCAPADMTIGFCFEGEPPETEESNMIKMVLYSSVVIDRMETNLDLDLIAGAIGTILYHFQVVKETVECAKGLIPLNNVGSEDPSASNLETDDDLSSTTSIKIQKSMKGRRILVHRQLHRSRETGGLLIANFLQVRSYKFTLWRHNVVVYTPTLSSEPGTSSFGRQKKAFPLLKLLSFDAKKIEVGNEVSFPEGARRIVLKCGVEEARLRFCNIDEMTTEAAQAYLSPDPQSELVDSLGDNQQGTERSVECLGQAQDPKSQNEKVDDNKEEPATDTESLGAEVGPTNNENLDAVNGASTGGENARSNDDQQGLAGTNDETLDRLGDQQGSTTDDKILKEQAPEEANLASADSPDHVEGDREGHTCDDDDDDGDNLDPNDDGDNLDPRENEIGMVEFFHFGRCVPIRPPKNDDSTSNGRERAILLRCEDYFSGFRSRSFAAEIGTGGTVSLRFDEFESVFLLVLEALVMPTWSKPTSFPLIEKRRFPERSVGSLLHSLLPGTAGRFRFWRLVRKLVLLLLPSDLRAVLLRVRMGDVLVTIPTVKGQHPDPLVTEKCDLMVRCLELLTWYIPPEDSFHENMMSAAALEGKPWSSLISKECRGFNQRLTCTQSFHVTSNTSDFESESIEVLPEFSVALDYLQAKITSSVENTLSVNDSEQLRDIARFMRRFLIRCVDIIMNLRRRLSFLKRRVSIPGEEEQECSEANNDQPISVVCADVEKSVREAKQFLLRMCREFDDNIHNHAVELRRKDEALERLQQLVFLKEKERIAAVAMATSPIAGWLRVGGTHQSGQRVASTSTLWRFWAVLRRDTLILYSAPGKYKPMDVVMLRGAKLRVLAGGRNKWELKRAFGIVESEGKTRFFVVESDDEYSGWTREIDKIISYHVSVENEKEAAILADNADKDIIPDTETTPTKSSDRDDKSVGLQSSVDPKTVDSQSEAKVDEQEVEGNASVKSESEGVSPSTPSQGFRSKLAGLGSSLRKSKQEPAPTRPTNSETDTEAPPEEEVVTATTSNEDADQSEPSESSDAMSTKKAEQDGNVSRRQQLAGKVAGVGGKVVGVGGKVVGVGKATGRWGSALISATGRKGREVADRTRRAASSTKDDNLNTSAHNTLHVISETETERSWSCPTCTFLNTTKESDVEILTCSMCETPTEASNIEFERSSITPNETTETEAAVAANADEQDATRDRLGSTDSDQDRGIFRRAQSSPIDARERLNSTDSDTGLFRRSQSSGSFGGFVEEDETSIISDLAMDEISEAARSAGRRPSGSRSRLGGLGTALGGSRRTRQNRPPDSSEKKGWFSRLGSNVSSTDEGDNFHKNQPALKLKNVRIDPSVDFVGSGTPSFNVPLRKLDGMCYALVTVCDSNLIRSNVACDLFESISKDGEGASVATPRDDQSIAGKKDVESTDSSEELFSIRVFDVASNDDHRVPRLEVFKTFSEVVGFHAEVSEVVGDLLQHPLFHEKSWERNAAGEMSSGLQNALGISPLDGIRISGAFLAGLVEARSGASPAAVPSSRCAEALTDFLNAALECPLSSAGHYALREFLSLQDVSSKEVWSDLGCDDIVTSEQGADGEMGKGSDLPLERSHRNSAEAPKKTDALMELSSKCMGELVLAEQNGRLATNLLDSLSTINESSGQVTFLEPLLPNHVTENLQEAMHAALMKVMAERDEAHAQLVSASVLHAHTLEQEKKKVQRLTAKLDLAKANNLKQHQGPMAPIGPLFGDRRKRIQEEQEEREKLLKIELSMQQNADAEIVALCNQLSGEIAARTQAALEVIRLKESRKIERQHEAEEKQALREELGRLKERLAMEEQKVQEAQREKERWQQYYELAKASNGLKRDGEDEATS
ncbi:expressed unknown protein [Seminavis robusta]|uniref:PH domain-containing protein n=1 Tax=Seminavis robusta TaxID=568900 RepID=A0A9N8H377_9STRA|nr:expressed unknown protein [Seminavis robusta]|eukprot:Sro82_g043880.1 n/a (3074) ;mRNA; f:61730-71345